MHNIKIIINITSTYVCHCTGIPGNQQPGSPGQHSQSQHNEPRHLRIKKELAYECGYTKGTCGRVVVSIQPPHQNKKLKKSSFGTGILPQKSPDIYLDQRP